MPMWMLYKCILFSFLTDVSFLENFVENMIFFKFLETLKMHVSKLHHTNHMHIISKGSRQGK